MDVDFIIQESLVRFKKEGEECLKTLDSDLNQNDPRNLPLDLIRSEIASVLNLSKVNALKGLCNEVYVSNIETDFKFFEDSKINKIILHLESKLNNIANFTQNKTEKIIKAVKKASLDIKTYQASLQPCLDKFNKSVQNTQHNIREHINSVKDGAMREKYKSKLKDIVDHLNKNSKALIKKYLDILK